MASLDAALLQAILAEPDNDEIRLVSADFWEEHGDLAKAEFVRVQVELWQLMVKWGLDPKQPDGTAQRHPRDWEECRRDEETRKRAQKLHFRERYLLSMHGANWVPRVLPEPSWCGSLYGQESKFPLTLIGNYPDGRKKSPIDGLRHNPAIHVAFHRGFIREVSLKAAAWLAHAEAIRAAVPVEAVTLTTWPKTEIEVTNHGFSAHTRLAGEDCWYRLKPERSHEFAASLILHMRYRGIDFAFPPAHSEESARDAAEAAELVKREGLSASPRR